MGLNPGRFLLLTNDDSTPDDRLQEVIRRGLIRTNMGPAGFEPCSHPLGMLREADSLAGILLPGRTPVRPSGANGGLRPTG
jgi:hypothetical protein